MTPDNFLPYLREHGLEIGRAARAGNGRAIAVIDWYAIYSKSPDNGALVALVEAVNHWQQTQESEEKS